MSGLCDTCKIKSRCISPEGGLLACPLYEQDRKSRWFELFGTPERAARTLEEFELDQINWCHGTDGCEKCPYEFDRYGCCLPDGFSLLEWLRGEI